MTSVKKPRRSEAVEAWRKSSWSGGGANGGNCVEVAVSVTSRDIMVRDTKHPGNGVLKVRLDEWANLLRMMGRLGLDDREDAPLCRRCIHNDHESVLIIVE